MPTFYNFNQNGVTYSFDDVFVPADLFREGNLWAWGNGNNGRIGNGATVITVSTPVTTFSGGINWKQVSGGTTHTAAIKTDGTLWTWGNGIVGQLGDATVTSVSTPVTTFSGGNDWKQVSTGNFQTAAIKTDGTLWVWGGANVGQLGNGVTTGNISTPITTFAGGTNWKQVSAGNGHTVAIKTDGILWGWGSCSRGQLGNGVTTGNISTPITTFAGGTNWKQVSAGSQHTTAIKTDGTLWTWGYARDGQLGNAQTTNRSTPVTTFAGGTNWKQVNSGNLQTAGIKTDGTLWVWGNGISGQLGDGTTTSKISTPITTFAGGTNWKQVTMGYRVSGAIKTDGTLWTWGTGGNGRLGNSVVTGNISTPVTTFAGGTNWKQISSGDTHIAALTYDDPVI
jgi:alpha-tubulin suppressor-like RCC1 family protein